ncbi:MAG: hypothetical protein MUE55_04295 [Thermoplasmata archaeon]|nr:hypothetical protein [Thermoplasmata archaeon]
MIQLLSLDRNESFIALLFGFGIDLDHLFGLRDYVAVNGLSGLTDTGLLMDPGGQWKSMLHAPVAAFVVGSVSLASRLAFPALFWFVHIAMDQLEDSFLGLFSIVEMVLMVSSAGILVLLRWMAFSWGREGASVKGYLRSELGSLRVWRAPDEAYSRNRVRGTPLLRP